MQKIKIRNFYAKLGVKCEIEKCEMRLSGSIKVYSIGDQ